MTSTLSTLERRAPSNPKIFSLQFKKKKSKKGSSTDLHIKVHLQVLKHYYICGKRLTKAFSISRAELCDEMPVT